MGDTFQKVRAGEPLQIQAETFNAFVDAARHHRQSQRSVSAETTDGSPMDSGRTRVRNQTGADCRRYEVLRIGNPLFGPSDNLLEYLNHTSFAGLAIEADDEDRVAILQEPCPQDAIREAIHSGVSIVWLTGETGLRRATTRANAYVLEASEHGPFTVLHDPGPANQERLAVVRFGQSPLNETVFFEITATCEDEDIGGPSVCGCGGLAGCFEATVLYEACGSHAPRQLKVYDLCRLGGDDTGEDLVGRRGVAVRMRRKLSGEESEDCCCWVVVSLCPPEDDSSSSESSEGTEETEATNEFTDSEPEGTEEFTDPEGSDDSEPENSEPDPEDTYLGTDTGDGTDGGSDDTGEGTETTDGTGGTGGETGDGSDGTGDGSGTDDGTDDTGAGTETTEGTGDGTEGTGDETGEGTGTSTEDGDQTATGTGLGSDDESGSGSGDDDGSGTDDSPGLAPVMGRGQATDPGTGPAAPLGRATARRGRDPAATRKPVLGAALAAGRGPGKVPGPGTAPARAMSPARTNRRPLYRRPGRRPATRPCSSRNAPRSGSMM